MKNLVSTVVVTLLLLSFGTAARAEIQTSGPQLWPGKIMVGVRPFGAQLLFNDAYVGRNGRGYVYGVGDRVLFKLALDVAGIVANLSKVTIWLGGEVNVGGRGNLAFLEPGIFVQITFEKLLKIPLVPMVRAGISGPIYVPYGYDEARVAGAAQLKVGAGAYYFLTKHIGLGADTSFAFGPGFQSINNNLGVGFIGSWDFTLGARFAF